MPRSPSIFLKKHADYQRAYASAARGTTRFMRWFAAVRAENDTVYGVRVGLTVPKAIGGAVQRNRIKRRMREAVKLALPDIAIANADIILHPRRETISCEWELLRDDTARAVRDALRAAAKQKAQNHAR